MFMRCTLFTKECFKKIEKIKRFQKVVLHGDVSTTTLLLHLLQNVKLASAGSSRDLISVSLISHFTFMIWRAETRPYHNGHRICLT